jgi:hypothetical protein
MLVPGWKNSADLVSLKFMDVISNAALRFAESSGQFCVRRFNAPRLAVGLQTQICKQLECAVGKQSQREAEAGSGRKPT